MQDMIWKLLPRVRDIFYDVCHHISALSSEELSLTGEAKSQDTFINRIWFVIVISIGTNLANQPPHVARLIRLTYGLSMAGIGRHYSPNPWVNS
jgi:hypothetical protein